MDNVFIQADNTDLRIMEELSMTLGDAMTYEDIVEAWCDEVDAACRPTVIPSGSRIA